MGTKIVPASVADLQEINELFYKSKAFWGYDENYMNKFMSHFGLTEDYLMTNAVYLNRQDKKLLGFYSFVIDGKELKLDCFFINPDYIRQGIGTRLWAHCCHTVKETYKRNRFILFSDPHAEKFYMKMGCKKIGTHESSIGGNKYIPILEYCLSAA